MQRAPPVKFRSARGPPPHAFRLAGPDASARTAGVKSHLLLPAAALLALLVPATTRRAPAQTPAPPPAPVSVLLLGTFHFGNPGQDLHNARVDDVRTPEKQAELADLAARLARFAPTKIVVEAVSDRPDLTWPRFENFTPETLTQVADERVQIGLRLAHQLGLPAVHAVDEQSDTFDYFPFGAVQTYAQEHGQTALLERIGASIERMVKEFEAAQKTTPVRLLLARANDPAQIAAMHREGYYNFLPLGDPARQPGADLNGAWYLRNAKIFAKLTQIARPGDRVLVVFGAGHLYWLRHFVEFTPGFKLVEPNDLLQAP